MLRCNLKAISLIFILDALIHPLNVVVMYLFICHFVYCLPASVCLLQFPLLLSKSPPLGHSVYCTKISSQTNINRVPWILICHYPRIIWFVRFDTHSKNRERREDSRRSSGSGPVPLPLTLTYIPHAAVVHKHSAVADLQMIKLSSRRRGGEEEAKGAKEDELEKVPEFIHSRFAGYEIPKGNSPRIVGDFAARPRNRESSWEMRPTPWSVWNCENQVNHRMAPPPLKFHSDAGFSSLSSLVLFLWQSSWLGSSKICKDCVSRNKLQRKSVREIYIANETSMQNQKNIRGVIDGNSIRFVWGGGSGEWGETGTGIIYTRIILPILV